jgi:uncharacterized integral membrane protein (TIGR00697 family)
LFKATHSIDEALIKQTPQTLWFLQTSYVAIILLANWFDIRLIRIGPIDTDAGTLIFPLTFILSDLITEVYGYKFARRAIWTGFLFNFIFIIFGQIVVHLPSPNFALITNAKFDELIGFNIRIVIASVVAYLFGEPLNSFIMAKMKILTQGRKIYLRFVLSTFIASFFDSIIFVNIAFYSVMPLADLIKFSLTLWLIKVAVEILGLPFSLYFTQKLKKLEKLDMYDIGTKFTIFSLESTYSSINNKYKLIKKE